MENNDFGKARFPSDKARDIFINCYGRIITVEKRVVHFQDNDGIDYLIYKKDFTFDKCEFKIK